MGQFPEGKRAFHSGNQAQRPLLVRALAFLCVLCTSAVKSGDGRHTPEPYPRLFAFLRELRGSVVNPLLLLTIN